MTKRYFKLLLSLGVILCVLCTSFTVVMAAPSWEDYLGPIESETLEEADDTTEVQPTETEPTTEIVTQKPTKPATTQNQVRPASTINATEKVTAEKTTRETTEKATEGNNKKTTKVETKEETSETVAETTDPDEALLEEGQFFVYLERNNGERRLKTILDKPGLVNRPNSDPIRVGYVFMGWYKDAECTIPWDFNKSIAQKGTVIYAKWESDGSTVTYNIKVEKVSGGTIEVNPSVASAGEAVIINVKPDTGKRLVAGSITINGKNSDVLSFIMPKGEVVVSASFEDIPEVIVEEETNPLIFVGIGAALLVIILIVVIIIVKIKTRPAVLEYDENGAIILDDDDGDGWIDESIVVEDGFANGKIVRESADFEDNYETESLDSYETETVDLFETESFDE